MTSYSWLFADLVNGTSSELAENHENRVLSEVLTRTLHCTIICQVHACLYYEPSFIQPPSDFQFQLFAYMHERVEYTI